MRDRLEIHYNRQWTEQGAKNEIAVFTNIDLYIKQAGEWSEAIPGTGGSMFVASERGGLYTSDECYKMALTDAISVACKALGVGADVYWGQDSSKYSPPAVTSLPQRRGNGASCDSCGSNVGPAVVTYCQNNSDKFHGRVLCPTCQKI